LLLEYQTGHRISKN